MDESIIIRLFRRKGVIDILRFLRSEKPIIENMEPEYEKVVQFPKKRFSNYAIRSLKETGYIIKEFRSNRCTLRQVGLEALKIFDSWSEEDFSLLNARKVQLFCWSIIQGVDPSLAYYYIGKDYRRRIDRLYSQVNDEITPLGEALIEKMRQISNFLSKRLPEVIHRRPKRFPEYCRHEMLLKYLQSLELQIQAKLELGDERKKVLEEEGSYEKHCTKLMIPKETFSRLMGIFGAEGLVRLNLENPRKKFFILRTKIIIDWKNHISLN